MLKLETLEKENAEIRTQLDAQKAMEEVYSLCLAR